MKKKMIIWLLVAATLLGGLKIFQVKNRKEFDENSPKIEKYIDSTKPNVQETVINDVKSIGELVVQSVDLSTNASLSKYSFVLKQECDITFKGYGKYFINLKNINKDQIEVSEKNVTLYLPVPKCSVELKPNEYKYSNNNGILMFSDLEVHPSQMADLEQQVKESMLDIMKGEDYMFTAKNQLQAELQMLLRNLTNVNYNVRIIFIGE